MQVNLPKGTKGLTESKRATITVATVALMAFFHYQFGAPIEDLLKLFSPVAIYITGQSLSDIAQAFAAAKTKDS